MGEFLLEARSDAELISASLADPEEFAPIFERHAAVVHRYLAARAEASAAADLLSEVFVAAFRSRRSYDVSFSDARPWLFGIATNVIRRHRRSEGRRLSMLERGRQAARRRTPEEQETEAVDCRVELQDSLDAVNLALARLDPKYRDVLLLFAAGELTYEEIARALRIPVGTVRSRLSRGRRRLRELLGVAGQYLDEASQSDRTAEELRHGR
jgi:RNA polymerase sigma-70 factor (ECF subfamily)